MSMRRRLFGRSHDSASLSQKDKESLTGSPLSASSFKEEKKAAKEKTRIELAKSTPMDIDSADTMAAMGFAGFGTSKK